MDDNVNPTPLNTKGKGKVENHPDEQISSFRVEAAKFGLRVLPKAKWEELRAEYLLYRQELVDEINAFQDSQSGVYSSGGQKREYVDETYDQEEQIMEDLSQQTNQIRVQSNKYAAVPADNSTGTTGIHPNSAYPPGCLMFVRNVHPDTNKTTLRSLFLHAWESGVESRLGGGNKDDDGIDYLDYTKGMDCVCVLFLRDLLLSSDLIII